LHAGLITRWLGTRLLGCSPLVGRVPRTALAPPGQGDEPGEQT